MIILAHYADMAPEKPDLPVPSELKGEKRNFPGTHDFLEITSGYETGIPPLEVDLWDDVALMVYTSGTTGLPKGAMLTYGNALFKTAAAYHANGVRPEDVALAVMPIFHIAGMVMGVNMPAYGANTTVLLTRFDPEAVLKAIETYRPSLWNSAAPMNAALINYPGVEKRDLSSLRTNLCTSFGIQLTEELASAWAEVTGGCQLYEAAYGLSETHTCDTFMPRDRVRYGSCGIPTYDTDVRIVDPETGEDLPPGKQGEIVIRNPGVFKGYWQKPEATMDTLRDGWVFTGDMGRISEDGYFYFDGRLKEMIKASGYSVFPEEVETMLLRHPAVAQAAVVGVPDPVRGESVKAFVVLKPEYAGKVREEDIIAWSKERMAAYKYPRQVEFRESLPATSTGKVLRRLLKEEGRN